MGSDPRHEGDLVERFAEVLSDLGIPTFVTVAYLNDDGTMTIEGIDGETCDRYAAVATAPTVEAAEALDVVFLPDEAPR